LWGGALFSSLAADLSQRPTFAMPAPTLRTNLALALAVTNTTAVEVVLTSEVSVQAAVQRYETLYGRPLLTPVPPRGDPGGAYGFLKNNVFDPITDQETVKVGKTHVTGSVVNAIKRKNPFCLLHPLIFAVDW
jgi:hypothetical protein